MAETEYRRLIQSAKDKALLGFLAVVQRAIQDADKNIVELMAHAKSGLDQTALTSIRHFLRQDGNVLLRRIDVLFRNYLDRAMQTMYVDMRPGMRKLSAGELSLIDDEVVHHQIEVGRLAERMREANEECIGRLNVIVAHMHGQKEARERENPFRPYLLARAMYEAVKETATDESKAKMLFEHLANALVQHLPGYYAAIREVFESSGVRGKFYTQRSKAAHHQRYFGAPLDQGNVGSRLMPALQRMMDTLQASPEIKGSGSDSSNENATVQEFIRRMFSPAKQFVRGAEGGASAASGGPLVAQLDQYQKMASRGQPVAPGLTATQNQLSAVRGKLDLEKASPMERMTIDVVAMLFEFILGDDQIPPELRQHIGRLQIPVLKAALLDPGLMHNEMHPARQLLNRMSSAVVATDPAGPAGQKLAGEIRRIVQKILDEFDADSSIFSTCVQQFESFLVDHLRRDDNRIAAGIEAVEIAEKFSVLLTNTTTLLCDILLPLNVDKRISDFIILVWPHVLVHAVWTDVEKQIAPELPNSLYQQCRNVLPELLWSIQEKADPAERSALMRLLPDLVKRLRGGLRLIQLPEDESRQVLDLLVEMHTQVMRAAPKPGGGARSLDELKQEFSRLVISWDRASWSMDEPPQPRSSVIEEVFARKGVSAELNLGRHTVTSSSADREFLEQTYLLGTRVALRGAEGKKSTAQLAWVSTHRSLYLFKEDGGGDLSLYTPASLLEALADETIVPLEYAPVFERAVESLLYGAGQMQSV